MSRRTGSAAKKPATHGKYIKIINRAKLQEIKQWKSDGLSNEQIAKNLKITHTTFYNWYEKHEEFRNAIDEGFDHNVYELENALYKSALGGHVQEKKVYKTTDEQGREVTRTEIVEKYVAPNPTSIIFSLKNKAPERWYDRKFVEHSGTTTTNINHYANLSEDELRKLAAVDGDINESDNGR